MRAILTSIFILLLSTSFTQKKLEKIIVSDNVAKLEKYIQKNDGKIDQLIELESDNGEANSFSPLMVALFEESDSIIQFFIKNLDLFDDTSHVVSEAFIHSLGKNDNPLSKQLYDLGANPNDSCNSCWGNNALMVTIVYGNVDWFYKLVDDTDFSYTNSFGENLAHIAAGGPSSKIARRVFGSKEIDINQKNHKGETPLDYAVWNEKNPKMMSYLLKNGALISEAKNLLEAWPFNPSEEIFYDNLIFNRKDDIWKTDEDGMIPLLWALAPEEIGEYTIQQLDLFKRILDMMMANTESTYLKTFQNENIYNYNSMNHFLTICELRGDFAFSIKVYADFVKLSAISEQNSEFRVLTKKDFKKASKIFGEDEVIEIYNDNDLWIP